METFSASLAICAENSPVPGEFAAQRPVTRGQRNSMEFQGNPGVLKIVKLSLHNTLASGLSLKWELFDKEGWYLYSDDKI